MDDKNHPVANATVQIHAGSKALGHPTTDAAGKVSLTFPAAGTYLLTVSHKGYVDITTAVEVSAASSGQEIDIVLGSAALSQQSITVTGAAPTAVAETESQQKELPAEQAKDSSERPNTLKDVLPLVPGIVRAKDGTVRIAGFGEDHSALLINSVDVTSPSTGSFGLGVPIDSVQTINVSEMPYLAQYGKFTAGVVTAETRRGGEKWDYSLNDPLPDFHIRSWHLNGLADAAPRFNFSGPLLKNKVYLVEGAEVLFNNQEVRTLAYPHNLTRSLAFNSYTQLDAVLTPSQMLTVSYHFAPHSLHYAGLDFFNPQSVTPDANFHESTSTITHRWLIGQGVLQSTVANTQVSSTVSAQGTGDMILTPVGNQGNYFSNDTRDASRFAWIEQWTPRSRHFLGEHIFQFGSVIGHSENNGRFQGRSVVLQDLTGQTLQRIDFIGGTQYNVIDTEPAIYAQDHWVLDSHLALDLGLRMEGQTITSTTRTAPRAGLVWSPDAGATVVRGGIGVFYDSVPLDVYAFNSYPEQVITNYRAGVPAGLPVNYYNITAESAVSNFPFIAQKSRTGNFAPYSVAWNVEAERKIRRWVTLRLKYLQSREQNMITLEPETMQGQAAYVLRSSGWAHTRQTEFTTRFGSEAVRQFFFSYVRQYARGTINDAGNYLGNFPLPVIQQTMVASLPSEIPNRFLLWGTYGKLPYKFRVSPHVEVRNGFPYQPTDVFQQYVAASGAQYRYPRYFSADLKVSKDFQVMTKHAVRFSLTIRNLTNHFNPLEVHSNVADPQYGTFFGNYDRKFLLDFDFLY